MKIILASNNEKKLKEFRAMLPECEFFLASEFVKNFDPIENGASFKQNAKIKAMSLFDVLDEEKKSEFCVLADDSGLSVEVLEGAPGIFSARFSQILAEKESEFAKILASCEHLNKDEKNCKALQFSLKKAGVDFSKAAFICVLAFVKGGKITFAKGVNEGCVSVKMAGANGFGYDPMFISDEANSCYVAELSDAEKNAISHRAKALKELVSDALFKSDIN